MTSDRRKFLRMAGAISTAAVAGIAAPAVSAAVASSSRLTRSTFLAAMGDDFMFEREAVRDTVAKLTKVEPLAAARTPGEAEHRFRAVFKVNSPEGLDQLTYRVRHPRMGEFVMFVSPKSERRDVVEAIFNRI